MPVAPSARRPNPTAKGTHHQADLTTPFKVFGNTAARRIVIYALSADLETGSSGNWLELHFNVYAGKRGLHCDDEGVANGRHRALLFLIKRLQFNQCKELM